MLLVIDIFSVLISIAGMILVLNPALMLDFIKRFAGNPVLYATAIIVRLVFGLLLVTYAGVSRFPLTVTFIGWIAVIAAVLFAWLGQERFTGLIKWILHTVTPFARAGGAIAILFGAFLLYAFL